MKTFGRSQISPTAKSLPEGCMVRHPMPPPPSPCRNVCSIVDAFKITRMLPTAYMMVPPSQ